MTTFARKLSLDFETASEVDLRRLGVAAYSRHLSTMVLCMAWAFDDGPVEVWRLGGRFPSEVLDHVRAGGTVSAWNAAFEIAIWNNTLMRQIGADRNVFGLSVAQASCTMATAAFWGLPLSLDQAAPAAGLSITKDRDGHRLMLQMCRPRNRETGAWWHVDVPARLDRLAEYCRRDVETERALARVLPPLPAEEQAIWRLDQRMNARGVGVDIVLANRLRVLSNEAQTRADGEIARLTGGRVQSVRAVAALLAWLRENTPYPHDNLRRSTVESRLAEADACSGVERDILLVRVDAARTSAAKLSAMIAAAPDGVARGLLQYYGAPRTGRWAGRLIQPQNMPRGVFETEEQVERAVSLVRAGASYECIDALFPVGVMAVVSSLLRSCLVPDKAASDVLLVADFSQIEARVLPWLAGDVARLDLFRSGKDVYVHAAAGIFAKRPEDVTKAERQIGKIAELALGYGGGQGAFVTMARGSRLDVGPDRAEEIKRVWRAHNPIICAFWHALETTARSVIACPDRVEQVGRIRVGRWGAHLVLRLPSGRPLIYRDAEFGPDGEITYMGVDQFTRRWTRLKTYGGKLAENVTQAVARCLMAAAMRAADREGFRLLLTVHDEIIAGYRGPDPDKALARLVAIMSRPPAWAEGLPLAADGFVTARYRK